MSLLQALPPLCSAAQNLNCKSKLRCRSLSTYWLASTLLILSFNVFLLYLLDIPCLQLLYSGRLLPKSGVEKEDSIRDETPYQIIRNDDKCHGRFIYVYPLPAAFNEDLVEMCHRAAKNCSSCIRWRLSDGGLSPPAHSICGRLENGGFGPLVDHSTNTSTAWKLEPARAWYRTTEGSLEVIFHERMKKYPCLAANPGSANAFYIPFYAALDSAFTVFSPHIQVRDRLSQRLLGWLTGNEVWREFNKKPHFTVVGRVVWDFCREEEKDDGWGNSYLTQRELTNVTKMLLERRVWDENDVGVPFPTSFHPSTDEDLKIWQETLRKAKREWLVTFVGSAKRGFNTTRRLREQLMKACKEREECQLGVKCTGEEGWVSCTEKPENVIGAFKSSVFCLQPEGDSATRKSLFDSLIAGCIPVMFTNLSAYHQYVWHLPNNGSHYSVFFNQNDVVDGKFDIVDELQLIPPHTVKSMQLTIIHLLPTIVYAPPSTHSFQDAFDIALQNFLTNTPIPTYPL